MMGTAPVGHFWPTGKAAFRHREEYDSEAYIIR